MRPIGLRYVRVHPDSRFGVRPGGSQIAFECVRSIPVRPRGCWVRSIAFTCAQRSSGLFGCIRFIPVHPQVLRVRSGAYGPFACALGAVGFFRYISVRLRSVFFRVRSVPVRPGVAAGFVWVHLVNSRAP